MKRGKRWIECLLVLTVLVVAIVAFRDSRTTALHKLVSGECSVLDDVAKSQDLASIFEKAGDQVEWVYRDVNYDGKDDLILQEKDCVMDGLKRIIGIFTETENDLVHCVLWDDVDLTTFYSLGADGLVYYTQYLGTYDYKAYHFYKYNETWNMELTGGLDAFGIEDMTELPIDFWEETYPDMTKPGNYYRSFTVENIDGEMVEKYRLIDEEEWKRALLKWYTPDYHAGCVEETIIRCNTFGDWVPVEKEMGATVTDFYYDPLNQTVLFVPQKSETGYELELLQNYDRYEIVKRDNVNVSELDWLGQTVVDYGVSGSYIVPELTLEDDEFLEALMQRIHKEFSVREELFSYDIYLGDFARGKNDSKDCALASLALIGEESYYIWAEITKEDSGYDVWMYPSPFGLPDESVLDARNSTVWENEIDCILALDNHLMKLEKTEAMKNAFFFPMISDTAYIDVACELNLVGAFEGTAKLKVGRVPDTKLDSYYELILTDLQGECSSCGDMEDAVCYYNKDFPIGYIYVSGEEIYLMDYSENYLDIFKEVECFPPSDEYVEELHESMMESGAHYEYFGYRQVCATGGREDTCGEKERIGFAENAPMDYHNYVAVEDGERQYVFEASEERAEWGANEYMSITWKENQGMTSYVNGAGARRDYISFWVGNEHWKEFLTGDFYTIYLLDEESDPGDTYLYEITGYDGNVICEGIAYKEPIITLYDGRYLEVRCGAGTGVWGCRYIDLQNDTVSEEYWCAIYGEDGIVGWVDVKENGDRTLRLEDVFAPDLYSWDLAVDFASEEEILVESTCLQEISEMEDGKVKIVYFNSEGIETEGWFDIEGWMEPEDGKLDILVDTICVNPKPITEHPLLSEFLKRDLEFETEFCEKFGSVPATMEYFVYDFNDDGLEDYFTCYYGSAWCGSAGNAIGIYVQEGDNLRCVFSANARVHGEYYPESHAPISILQSKSEGFYDIVIPARESSAVWRYAANSGRYEFVFGIVE